MPTGSHVALNVVKREIFRTLLGSFFIMSMLTPFGESGDSTLTLHIVVQHFFYLARGSLLASGADLLVLGASKFSRNLLSIYAWLLKVNASFNTWDAHFRNCRSSHGVLACTG